MQKLVYDIQNDNTDIVFKNNSQNAIVIMNNQNGAVIALGGGRGQDEARMFNRATSAYIQPGSTVKPIFEYVLAFDQLGWATSHTITDRPIYLYNGKILIVNAGGQAYTGDMLVTEAIARSLNTPAIQALEAVIDEKGEEFCVDYLNSIGFDVKLENFDLQYAIGGNTFMVTPMQLAGAHAMIINEGMYVEPHTIDYIEYSDGTRYEADTVGTRVVSPAAAYMTSTCLEYNVSGPYFNYMQVLRSSYPVFAKTGTTDWGSAGVSVGIPRGASKDAWLVCQTSNYTVSIWYGFDKMEAGAYFTSADDSYNLKGRVGRLILDSLVEEFDYGPTKLEQPDDCVSITHIKGAYPYCYPTAGESVTGLIRDEFYKLVNVSEIERKTINSSLIGMSGKRNEDGSITINWLGFGGDYGDGSQDLTATNMFGDVTPATGRCFFPLNNYINPDFFYANVYVNGYQSDFIVSSSPSTTTWVDAGNVEVCGWTSSSDYQRCANIK